MFIRAISLRHDFVTQLFSVGIFVSCYYKSEGGIELLIGTGKVIHIQDNGTIQVLIYRFISVHQNILDLLANNNSQVISKLAIKPTIRSIS